MNGIRREQIDRRKKRISTRLADSSAEDRGRPMFSPPSIEYELADRTRGLANGGLGAVHKMAEKIGLVDAIDRHLQLLKIHAPYHESDHVLNVAYNALVGGTCLDDIELRRNDEVFLDGLGTERIPDPTTAGDFCRRFEEPDIYALFDAFDEARLRVWQKQPAEFFQQAIVDLDGTLVATTGQCKQGIDIAYDGTWSYHPLLMSLANTGEVLSIVNRPGNRPSHEGAAAEIDRAIALCERAGFQEMLFRGDTDFSQTKHLDRWDDNPAVKFIFGLDVQPGLHQRADELPDELWEFLQRPDRYEVKTKPRARPPRWKEKIVFLANDRCHQENLIEQLKNGVRSLRAPVDSLLSNWAYMAMASLAWNLKAWWALMLPEQGRWQERHRQEKQTVLRMEFKRFMQSFIHIPCQLVKSGGKLIYRLISWNPYLHIFSRFLNVLRE